jgi:hypothetical protein
MRVRARRHLLEQSPDHVPDPHVGSVRGDIAQLGRGQSQDDPAAPGRGREQATSDGYEHRVVPDGCVDKPHALLRPLRLLAWAEPVRLDAPEVLHILEHEQSVADDEQPPLVLVPTT